MLRVIENVFNWSLDIVEVGKDMNGKVGERKEKVYRFSIYIS
jgi:hypothetical protein